MYIIINEETPRMIQEAIDKSFEELESALKSKNSNRDSENKKENKELGFSNEQMKDYIKKLLEYDHTKELEYIERLIERLDLEIEKLSK